MPFGYQVAIFAKLLFGLNVNTLSKIHAVSFTNKQDVTSATSHSELSATNTRDSKLDFASFYREQWRGLCAFLRKTYGAGPPEPEDVAQDAFFQLANMKCREHIENPKAFLYKISINLMLRKIKSERWISHVIADDEEAFEAELLSCSEPDKVLLSQRALQRLGASFNQLSDKQKYIVTASRIDGKTYQQIANETGWSLADICRQLNSALLILAESSNANEQTHSHARKR
tara:strand:- start:270 stop:959 length:690 start_codon:yes stop_codon:yes gene_type:complete